MNQMVKSLLRSATGRGRCKACHWKMIQISRRKRPEIYKTAKRRAGRTLKMEAMQAYGGVCLCCTIADLAWLSLDHIVGDGGGRNRPSGGGDWYRRLRTEGWPSGLQVLCHNCNTAKYLGGCPHVSDAVLDNIFSVHPRSHRCSAGHEWVDFRILPSGYRICHICQRQRQSLYPDTLQVRNGLLLDLNLIGTVLERSAEIARHRARRQAWQLKMRMIAAYGGSCQCCHEAHPLFLNIDHPSGDGGGFDRPIGGMALYRQLQREQWPDKYRLLCLNCNRAEWLGGCPHKDDRIHQAIYTFAGPKEFCPNNHRFDDDCYVNANGTRVCRVCKRLRESRRADQKRRRHLATLLNIDIVELPEDLRVFCNKGHRKDLDGFVDYRGYLLCGVCRRNTLTNQRERALMVRQLSGVGARPGNDCDSATDPLMCSS